MYQHHDTSAVDCRWLPTPRSYHPECIHRVAKRQQECSHGDGPKENPGGQCQKDCWRPGCGGDGPQDYHSPNLTTRQRQGKLFEELDLGGLNSWLPELAEDAHQLLAEYHDVFSLEPAELGCTHSTKHTVRVTDDVPFKE